MSQGGFGSPEEYQEYLRLRQQTQPQQATTPPTPLAVPQTAPSVATLTPVASGMAPPLLASPRSQDTTPFSKGLGPTPFRTLTEAFRLSPWVLMAGCHHILIQDTLPHRLSSLSLTPEWLPRLCGVDNGATPRPALSLRED
jgi:hypothetical protein